MNILQEKEQNGSNTNTSSEELKLISNEGRILPEEDLEPIIGLKRQVNYEKANIFSLLFFNWSKYAIKLSNTQGLKTSDVGEVQKTQSTEYNIKPIKNSWEYYSSQKKDDKSYKYKYPLIYTIFSVYYKIIIILTLFDFFNMILDYIRIYIFKQLITCFSKRDFFPQRKSFFETSIKDYILNFKLNAIEAVFGFVILRIFRSFFFHQLEFYMVLLNEKITNGLTALVFEKILNSNNLTYKTKGEGEKINLIEVDAEKVGTLFRVLPRVVISPFRIGISLYFLFKQFGKKFSYAIIILLIVLLVVLLLQVIYIKNYKKILSLKDARLKIVTYVFQVLKCIKLNGWDDEFIRRIKMKRDSELSFMTKNLNIQIIKMLLNSNLFLIIMLFSLNFYMEKNEDIEISSLSSSIQLVRSMTFPINAIPSFLNMVITNILSIERLQNFLYGEEHEENIYKNKKALDENNIMIKFDNNTFGIKDNKNIMNIKNKIKKEYNFNKDNKKEIELKEIFLENKKEQEQILLENNNKDNKLEIKELINKNNNKLENKEIILLENISLEIKKGEFVIILGPTGSGKSSLINAILNNCYVFKSSSRPIINGELSYYSQQPWIMSDTLKNNILFFKEYDQEKYLEIIKICQLEKDLELLPYGENTEINSTSSNVSGGQRARISLARTLYKEADLYLIDDPFASVDNKVGTEIFKEVFCSFLKGKTRILITNEMRGLSFADKIIYMEKGKIIFSGNYQEFHEKFGIKNLSNSIQSINSEEEDKYNEEEKNVRRFMRKYSMAKDEDNKNKDEINVINDNSNKSLNKKIMKQNFENNPLRLLEKEKKGKTIDFEIYHEYIKLQGGYIIFSFLIILIIISKITDSYRRTFMNSLSKSIIQIEKDKNNTNNKTTNLEKNYNKYVYISILGIFLNFLCEFIITRTTVHSLRKIHEDMVSKFIRAPINLFHDIVPIGQILNRLTKDILPVQGIIRTVNFFLRIVFSLITSIGLCYIYNKTTLITSPLLIIICIFITRYYISAGRNLTRLHKISFAPIITILSETIRGIDTIRAGHVENFVKKKIYKKLDNHYGVHVYIEGCRRWFNLRMRLCSHLFFGATLFYMVYYSEYFSAQNIAIIIHATEEYIEQLIGATTFFSNLEITMIGFERCQAVQKIKTEKISDKDGINNKELTQKFWPQNGNIIFDKYNTSYRKDTPIILKDINYNFKGGEKIGVLGRTGSGKSSIVLAIARIIEPKNGIITIDGIDTQKINLDFLREHLSIVPQDPFIFEGTLRDNIDPLRKYTDEKILKILEDFCLFKELKEKEKLNYEILENGKNLSPGQKQLICFVRAVIKNNKIVILDEATSSLDYETENTIKKNMEKYFKNCTLIMITHHISMVKDFKNIIVIDKGEIINEGSYEKLMKERNGLSTVLYEDEKSKDNNNEIK